MLQCHYVTAKLLTISFISTWCLLCTGKNTDVYIFINLSNFIVNHYKRKTMYSIFKQDIFIQVWVQITVCSIF